MGSMLMYELLAEERAANYRAEAENERRSALFQAARRRARRGRRSSAAPAAAAPLTTVPFRPAAPGRPDDTRRALVAALVGFATFGALRRRINAPR